MRYLRNATLENRSFDEAFREARTPSRLIPRKRTTSRHHIYVPGIGALTSFGTWMDVVRHDDRNIQSGHCPTSVLLDWLTVQPLSYRL